jgi:hypothetical protein
MASRLVAFREFHNSTMAPPLNISWFWLMLHQVVWGLIAVQNPVMMKVTVETSPQTIKELVNNDIMRISEAATGKAMKKDLVRGNKVHIT